MKLKRELDGESVQQEQRKMHTITVTDPYSIVHLRTFTSQSGNRDNQRRSEQASLNLTTHNIDDEYPAPSRQLLLRALLHG